MNMQLMLGVGVLCYFVSLALICLWKDRLNLRIANLVFAITDIILFFLWHLSYAQAGMLRGLMTLENISPLVFTLIPLSFIMTERVRNFAFSAIAFLHLGLFLATLISPEYVVIFNYKTEATFPYAAEAMCHLLSSLFGIYLIITDQVKTDFKSWVKSVVFLVGIISCAVVANVTLDTRFFNMNPTSYRIYMLDIFDSFEATLAAYLFGIIIVLTLGMQTGALWKKIVDKLHTQASDGSSKLQKSSTDSDS